MALDAHISAFDIIFTGVVLSEKLRLERCVVAVSAYDYDFPLLRRGFFSRINAMYGMELYPVHRESDLSSEKRKRVFERAVSANTRRAAVISYLHRSEEAASTPNQMVLVATYNGEGRLGNGIASGVHRMLKTGSPGICTFPVFKPYKLKFHNFISKDLIEFPPGTSVRRCMRKSSPNIKRFLNGRGRLASVRNLT